MKLPSIDLSAHTANITLRQRVMLGVVVAGLVIVAYWQLFLSSEWAARSTAQAELTRLKAEVEQARRIAGQKASLEREIKTLESQLQQTIQQLPAEKEIPSLLKRVASLGQETDLDVTLFKPGTPVAKEFYAEVPVQLKVAGTYHDLGLFFERFGRLERIVNVADLTIRPAAKGQKAADSIQAEFGVVTYTYSGAAGAEGAKTASATK